MLKSDRPQAFTGKRCGLGVLEGQEKRAKKKETQRIPSLFFSKLPDESKTIQCKPSVRTCFELGTLDLVDEGGEAFLVEDGHVGKTLRSRPMPAFLRPFMNTE